MKKKIILLLIIICICSTCGCISQPQTSSQKLVVTTVVPVVQTTVTSPPVLYQDKKFLDTVKSSLLTIMPISDAMDIDLQYMKTDELEKDAASLEIQSKNAYDSINSISVSKNLETLKGYYLKFFYNEQKYGETIKLSSAAANQGNNKLAIEILQNNPKYAEEAHFWFDKATNELNRLNG